MGRIVRWEFDPSMRNLLDASSVAQSLDGNRLTGSLRIPRTPTLVSGLTAGKRQPSYFRSPDTQQLQAVASSNGPLLFIRKPGVLHRFNQHAAQRPLVDDRPVTASHDVIGA